MSYLGNTPTTQSFIAGTDTFSGTGAQTVYTLSRSVNSVNDILVVVNNVDQQPTAYTVSGTTLTFTAAPSSGTNNIYVRYLSTTLQSIAPSQGSVSPTSLTTGGPYWDTNGNVGIGTATPAGNLEVYGAAVTSAYVISDTSAVLGAQRFSDNSGQPIFLSRKARGTYALPSAIATSDIIGQWVSQAYGGTNWRPVASINVIATNYTSDTNMSGALTFSTNNAGISVTERMRIDSAGNLLFDSGYGSVATAYGCRAWVNFNGTGTVAIRASGNVSSISDNGVGDYTVNFTTAMPNASYAMIANAGSGAGGTRVVTAPFGSVPIASSFRLTSLSGFATQADAEYISAVVFR